ncbi:unnamed protein product [Effrenium voratum]|nr:unnamed protein product [Effrenium voratum]
MPRFRPIPWLWLINPTQARFCIETCTLFKERQTFRLDQDVYRLGTDYGLVERNHHYRCPNTQIVLAYYFVSYGWRAGGGILVDASSVGRPVGDTSSSAVFVSELPKNFQGGDEALHFALGDLFGQYGKIKKIELYMDQGILETEDFKGEALVVYHTGKFTGTHDKGVGAPGVIRESRRVVVLDAVLVFI